jgi:hypothetical protein
MTIKEKTMARASKSSVQTETVLPPKNSLYDRVAGFLDTNDWHYRTNEEKRYFDMNVGIRYASVRVIVDTDDLENWQRASTYSVLPVQTPENRRGVMLEAINRINHSLSYGNLEMDMDDGEVRIRTVVEAQSDLAEELMERMLHSNLNIANRFFAPLMAVAFGNADPATVREMAAPNEGQTVQ